VTGSSSVARRAGKKPAAFTRMEFDMAVSSMVKLPVPLRDALASAVARLTTAQVPSARRNAELLLMFTLSCDRAYLHAHPERELTPEETRLYEQALAQRARGMPAQYITQHQEFWGMDLVVGPAVLIPRPETEHLIETVLPLARLRLHPRMADVGTGSGCIALALARELPSAEIHATDISAEALSIAQANAARHQLEKRIHFHQADLLEGLDPAAFDFIVSNPPYVGEGEKDQVQLEVRKFEPRHAVFAGPTGLEVIERLIPAAQAALQPGGWLVMEISGSVVAEVRRLLAGWKEVQIIPDLQDIPRVAAARKPDALGSRQIPTL
jgi:release factor glutamine methyltransferase